MIAGFRLINCSWSPLYVVAPDVHWTPEQVYEWNVYRWQPVHGGSPYIKTGLTIPPTEQVEGGQLLAWGDRIMNAFPDDLRAGVRAEQSCWRSAFPRLPRTRGTGRNCPISLNFRPAIPA